MKPDRVLSMLGIAEKAGSVQSGEFCTENAIKSGKAALVIVAQDASDNTKKKFENMCEFRQIPFAVYGTKEELGHHIGKEFRASLAVTNEGIANTLQKQLDIN